MPPLPNHLPALPTSAPYRLALLLPWPSEDDCRIGQPLTGSAGHLLKGMLAGAGLLAAECAICHLSQQWLSTWEAGGWDGDAIQGGIAALAADLAAWRPNLVLGLDDPRLGAGVLHLLRHGNVAPHRTPSGYQWPSALGKWRGSLFMSQSLGGVAKEAALSTVEPSGAGEGNPSLQVSNPVSTSNLANRDIEQRGDCGGIVPSSDGSSPSGICGSTTAVGCSFKCLTTYSPVYLLSVWSKAFDARQDILRARTEARTAELVLPATRISYGPVE